MKISKFKSYERLTGAGQAFSGSVHLGDGRNVEPSDKFAPNLRPQSVAVHQADLVLPLFRTRWCGQ